MTRNVVAAGAARKAVMKRQEWRGFVVGIFASLGLIGSAGAGVARAQVAPQVEASFDLPAEEGVARATVAPQVEASFDLPTEEGVAAHGTVASPSAVQFGLRTEQLQGIH